MFYCFSSGIQTIPANTEINLANQNTAGTNPLYSVHPIKLNRLTTDIDAGAGTPDNIFVNWRRSGSGKWTFDVDVPIHFIFGTPQFPYYLDDVISLENEYLDFKIINRNANAVDISIAFFGSLLSKSNILITPNKDTLRRYNYQIKDFTGLATQVENGVVTLPVSAPPAPFQGELSLINSFDDYFQITNLWQWLTMNLDERIIIRTDNSAIPLINNYTYVRQIFGQANQKFDLEESIWLKKNERLYIDIRHNQVAPIAPYDISLNFGGNLYQEANMKKISIKEKADNNLLVSGNNQLFDKNNYNKLNKNNYNKLNRLR